jgi:preprotein translocase subunit Sec61beta
MPSSQGGLIRYFDDYRSKIQLSPLQVIIISVAVVVIVILLHAFGKGILGI